MALAHPRAARSAPTASLPDPLRRSASPFASSDTARPGGAPASAFQARPGSGRPRIVGRPRFEALRALTLTPLDEARALDARAFADLPLPTVLELEVPGWSGPVWLRSASGRGVVQRDPVIDGPAWRALLEAVESDRVRPIDFRQLVSTLAASGPETDSSTLARAEIARLLDGVSPEVRGWSVGRVLERLGARLFSVRIEEPEEQVANGPVLRQAG